MSANERQVGGDHYKQGGEEHWDRVWRLYGRGYFVGCITKYVERYHLKNGVQDLEKAKHFLEKLIELESINSTLEVRIDLAEVLSNTPEVQRHPIAKAYGAEIKPTGWVGYTFEGADSEGFLFTCNACRSKFYSTPFSNPNDVHSCAQPEAASG